jgi:hypothetical protein
VRPGWNGLAEAKGLASMAHAPLREATGAAAGSKGGRGVLESSGCEGAALACRARIASSALAPPMICDALLAEADVREMGALAGIGSLQPDAIFSTACTAIAVVAACTACGAITSKAAARTGRSRAREDEVPAMPRWYAGKLKERLQVRVNEAVRPCFSPAKAGDI